ncbi:MAG: hypothetical protein ABW185_21715 [Sedimenticola sp.]
MSVQGGIHRVSWKGVTAPLWLGLFEKLLSTYALLTCTKQLLEVKQRRQIRSFENRLTAAGKKNGRRFKISSRFS